jgi:hypothetical protein
MIWASSFGSTSECSSLVRGERGSSEPQGRRSYVALEQGKLLERREQDGLRHISILATEELNIEKHEAYLRAFHAERGASKQVIAEMIAQDRRRTLDQLTKWYEQGWEYWVACCEFEDYRESLCGIDSLDYAQEVCQELALEVASQMEKDGYVVTGQPLPEKRFRGWTRDGFRENLRRNLQLGCSTLDDDRQRWRRHPARTT